MFRLIHTINLHLFILQFSISALFVYIPFQLIVSDNLKPMPLVYSLKTPILSAETCACGYRERER